MAGGIGLYGLVCDSLEDPSAEIYSAAVTREQALIVFKDAKRMVEMSPELSEMIEVNVGSLVFKDTNSIFRPVSSEHRGLDGKRVHMAMIDELHEHPTPLVTDKMRAGTKSRRNALLFEITNSGYDRRSVCWKHHEYSTQILEDSRENEAWFGYVCALDKGDEWTDEKVWPKTNPGLGTIIGREYLSDLVREAEGMPSKENITKRLNFCIWTAQATRWIDMPTWTKCSPPRSEKELLGQKCFGGLDLASISDLTALAFLFYDEEDDAFDLLLDLWIPESALEVETSPHSEADRMSLLGWAQQGFINVTPGNVTDYDFIEKRAQDMAELYDIQEIAYDRWNATQTVTHLKDSGAPMVEFGQGYASMSAPTKQFERLVKLGTFRHGNNPAMTWMVSNVSVKQDPAGNIKPDKSTSGEKIDGPVAAIMALGLWVLHEKGDDGPGDSAYEERGFLEVGY